MKLAVVVGTRPEFVKMSPIIRECERQKLDFFILHTGQHYSWNMDKIFFEQLCLPNPKYNLGVGSGTYAEEVAKMLLGIEGILLDEKPSVVLVEGDTNSALAGALAASQCHIPVGHVEAGLRSYDRNMPEEINRVLVDHCSDYLFAPTEKAATILYSEGISDDKIFVTGNTIVDAIYENLQISKQVNILDRLNIGTRPYILATIHRQENVDNQDRLISIIVGLKMVGKRHCLPIVYPIHPRSHKMILQFGIKTDGITLVEPMDYQSFLQLERGAKLIMTDSGGVQEEACVIGVPCVTLRDNTERPETVEVGANVLAGVLSERIAECASMMMSRKNSWLNPFGDGKAAQKLIEIINK